MWIDDYFSFNIEPCNEWVNIHGVSIIKTGAFTGYKVFAPGELEKLRVKEKNEDEIFPICEILGIKKKSPKKRQQKVDN